jgi:hypothetical protein
MACTHVAAVAPRSSGSGRCERRLTGLRAYTRAVDGDRVATFAQATQECLGECGIAEEVLPGGERQICSNQSWLAPMPLFHEFEEDVRLLLFYVAISLVSDTF